jgi:multidrug efflux pump subunit AcrA (membrane-fusion protein)
MGEIVFVSPEINPVSGQVRVWAEVDNLQGYLKPGMRATMTVDVRQGEENSRNAVQKVPHSIVGVQGDALTVEAPPRNQQP